MMAPKTSSQDLHPIRKEYCIYMEKCPSYRQFLIKFHQSDMMNKLILGLRVMQGRAENVETLYPCLHGVYRDFKDLFLEMDKTNSTQTILKQIENLTDKRDSWLLLAWMYTECPSIQNAGKSLQLMNELMNYIEEFHHRDPELIKKGGYAFEYFSRGRVQVDEHLIHNDYTLSINSNPHFPLPLNNRAIGHVNQGRYDKALQDYAKSIQLDPLYVLTYQNRASLYSNQLDEYEKALKDFDRAINLGVEIVSSLNMRFDMYKKRNEFDKALKDINTICEMVPNAYENFIVRADLKYYAFQNPQAALEDCSHAVQLCPSSLIALYNRGLLLGELGHPQASLRDFSRAISIGEKTLVPQRMHRPGCRKITKSPKDQTFLMSNLYLCRSITLRTHFHDSTGSLTDAKKALEIQPRNDQFKQNYQEALRHVFKHSAIGNA